MAKPSDPLDPDAKPGNIIEALRKVGTYGDPRVDLNDVDRGAADLAAEMTIQLTMISMMWRHGGEHRLQVLQAWPQFAEAMDAMWPATPRGGPFDPK